MALFKLPPLKFWQRSPTSNASGIAPVQPIQPATPPSPQPLVPQVKSITALERELEAEAKRLRVHPTYPIAPKRRPNRLNQLMWLAILVGLPVGVLWVVNLPYPPIRYPVARTAPILLLPSYISIDSNYREAIARLLLGQTIHVSVYIPVARCSEKLSPLVSFIPVVNHIHLSRHRRSNDFIFG